MIPRWFSSRDLNLHGELALEWDDYVKCLILAGITLLDASDQFVWLLNKQYGNISAKLAYNSLVQKHSIHVDCLWAPRVWNGKIPLLVMLSS